MNEEKLVRRVLDGEPEAKRTLIREYHSALKRMVLKYHGSEHYEDILQDTWIQVFRKLHTFQHRSSLKTWLIRIALNMTHQYHHNSSVNQHDSVEDLESLLFDEQGAWKAPLCNWAWHSSSAEASQQGHELETLIDKAIATLADEPKLVLVLHDQQGLGMQEICNILEISYSNARVRLHRARQQLLQKVDRYFKENDVKV